MGEYDGEFLAFYRAYGPVKNQSKKDAFKAWGQVEKSRPDTPTLIKCARLYNEYLRAQTKKERREVPKCHAATWLRQERWDSWLTAIPKQAPSIIKKPLKDKRLEVVRDALSEKIFDIWFAGAYVNGETIFLQNRMRADYVRSHFYAVLDRAFPGGWAVKSKEEGDSKRE